ncbi:MAG: hypothetical protein V1776_03300 [Candidatus Diapherotrites archaeon]
MGTFLGRGNTPYAYDFKTTNLQSGCRKVVASLASAAEKPNS